MTELYICNQTQTFYTFRESTKTLAIVDPFKACSEGKTNTNTLIQFW